MGVVKSIIDLFADINARFFNNPEEFITGDSLNAFLQDFNVSAVNRLTDAALLGVKEYNTSRQYASGEGCFYTGNLYQSNKITGPGAFVALDWDIIGGGSGGTFVANIPVVLTGGKSFGKYTNGMVIPAIGLTPNQVIIDSNTEYLSPSFSAFYFGNNPSDVTQLQQIEVGSTIASGSKTFHWSTLNSGNITANTIIIRNVTGVPVDYLTAQANDGTENYTLGAAIAFSTARTETFRILATPTSGSPFQRDFAVRSTYKIFYGDSATAPTTSANVRALANTRFTDAGNTFILNTGSTNRIFSVWLPTGQTLTNVTDLDDLGANITSQYIGSALSVNDANSNPVTGTLYTMTQAVPYSVNKRHQITIS